MGNCYFIGTMLVMLLGSFCLYNCYHRIEPSDDDDWQGCRDQEGRQIDSFILYKLPQDRSSQYSLVQRGLAYMYLIPDAPVSFHQSGGVSSLLGYSDNTIGWLLSDRSIGDLRSMPGITLSLLYHHPQWAQQKTLYIFYNDEFPNGTTSETHGHTKGVVMMTEKGGFWLVHSVPRYPPAPPQPNAPPDLLQRITSQKAGTGFSSSSNARDSSMPHQQVPVTPQDSHLPASGDYDYPATGTRYGQTFMCISLPPSQADNVGLQLLHNKPYIYSSHIGAEVRSRYPVLERVLATKSADLTTDHRVTELESTAGNTFTSFAKTAHYGKDLYSGLVAPALQASLVVETWRNGPGPLPSVCSSSSYRVENVEQVSVRVSGMTFSTHRDHSKWAASNDSAAPFVCVGDINRMASQLRRAGGTVCVRSETMWNRFFRLVSQLERCHGP